MRPLRHLPITLFTFLAILSLPAIAQDQAGTRKKACVVFTMEDLSGGTETSDYAQAITASVSAAIEVGGFAMVARDSWENEVQKRLLKRRALLTQATALAVANAVTADLAVTGYYTVQDEQIFVSLQCWDVRGGRLIAGMQQKARFNLAFYSSLHDRVAEMIPGIKLQEEPPQSIATAAPRLTLPEITFLSPDEGMEVLLAGDASIGVITDGRLVWKSGGISPGTKLNLEKRKQGFHTASQTVRAVREIRLSKIEKIQTRALEADWTWGQLLGLGTALRIYTVPDTFFIFGSGYLFMQPPLSSAGSPIFHFDETFGLGGYLFFPPDFPVRLGISTGVGIVVTIPASAVVPPAADIYLNVINWWVETRVLGPVIFLRQEWKFTTGVGFNYLGTQWMTVANIAPMTLGVLFRW